MTEQEEQKSLKSRTLEDRPLPSAALAVLGVIGGGIGGIGFVTFVGGAVMLARFRGSGIPGTGGVAKKSRAELLTIGADQLLAPFLISLTLALIVSVAYRRLGTGGLRKLLLVGAGALALAQYVIRSRPHIAGDHDQQLALYGVVLTLVFGFLAARATGEQALAAPEATDERAEARAWRARVLLPVSIFITGAVVGGFSIYSVSLTAPSMQAAAVSLAGGGQVVGLYVGESGSTVYLGQVPQSSDDPHRGSKSKGRLVALRRDNVAEMRVGYFEPLPKALAHARELACQLSYPPPSCPPPRGTAKEG